MIQVQQKKREIFQMSSCYTKKGL